MKRIFLTIIFALFLIPFLAYSQTVEDFSDETISSNSITTNTGLVISSDLVWSTYSNELVYNDVTMSPPIPYINPSTINNYFEISLNDQNQVLSSISFDLWLNYGGMIDGNGDMGCDCTSYDINNQLIETISKGTNTVAKNFQFTSDSIKKIVCRPTNPEAGNGLMIDDISYTTIQSETSTDILLSGTISAESNQIKNVAEPTDTQDAATKGYVDNNVNSFSGSYNDLTDQPSLRDLTGDSPVIFGSLSAFGGNYNNRAILDLVANTEGNLITGYKNGSSGDRFNVKLDNTNENAIVSSGGGYNLKLYSEGGTMEFEGDAMMSTPSFTFNGAVTATSFAGDGSQLTNLPTSDVSYNDLTDKPTTYTQTEVNDLIEEAVAGLQSQIDALQFTSDSGTVTDQDRNSYTYLTYGDQVWTLENAEMITYRDGTTITQVTDQTAWANLTTGAWCYYDNDASKGKLYNWYAVAGIHDNDENTPNKEFAPEGWHVPTHDEWSTLEEYLIANGYNYDDTTTGDKIAKAMASTTGWNSSTSTGSVGNDQSLNNSSGFNAFPEGYRYNGSFYDEGKYAYFWSSTESSTDNAGTRFLAHVNSSILGPSENKQTGFSVRFVRD